jgi:hypothetical protein
MLANGECVCSHTSSCHCSCPCSCLLSSGCLSAPGPIMVLSLHKRRDALSSPAVSSHDPRWIVLRAALLLPPHRVGNQRLLLCDPGGRSKADGERPNACRARGLPVPTEPANTMGSAMRTSTRLPGDGVRGQAERIQRWRPQACRTTFSARLHTPLYRLKTPSQRVALVLGALAEGLDLSAAERVFGIGHATITSWRLAGRSACPDLA